MCGFCFVKWGDESHIYENDFIYSYDQKGFLKKSLTKLWLNVLSFPSPKSSSIKAKIGIRKASYHALKLFKAF